MARKKAYTKTNREQHLLEAARGGLSVLAKLYGRGAKEGEPEKVMKQMREAVKPYA